MLGEQNLLKFKNNLHFSSQNLNLHVFLFTNQQKVEINSIKYFSLVFKNILKCSAMLSTVNSEMAQKVPNGVSKSICRSWLGK